MISIKIKYKIIQDVLLNGGSKVNIITSELYKNLDYNMIESVPFTIKMANQQKVNPIGIIKDF